MREWLIGTLLLSLGSLACGGAESDLDEPNPENPIEAPRIDDPDLVVSPVATLEPRRHIDPTAIILTPTANPGEVQEIVLGDRVHLDGAASTSPNAETLTYIWSVEQRPVGSFFELGEDAPITIEGLGLASFLPDHTGTWGVGLVVDDGVTRSPQSFVHIRVIGPSERPVAHVATSSSARVGEAVVVDGSGSTNPLEHVEALEFSWEPASLPEESRCLGTVEGIDQAQLSFIPDVAGRYVFVLQVEAAGIVSEPTYHGFDVAR